MKKIYAILRPFVLLVLWLGVSQQVAANNTFGFRVTVNTNGNGKVYYSREAQTVNPNTGEIDGVTYENSFNNQDFTTQRFFLYPEATSTVYVAAKPNNGYIFNGWTTNSTGVEFQNAGSQYTPVVLTSSESGTNFWGQQNRQSFTLTANFVQDKGFVKVISANPNWGTVSISNIQNVIDEQVTITAIPLISLQGVRFDHWTKTPEGGTEEVIVGGTAQMTVKATSTKTTYKAYFTPPAETRGVFCRIKNKVTNQYLYMYGTEKADFQSTGSGNNRRVFAITNGFKTTTDYATNPSTVFFLSGVNDGAQGLEQCHMQAQGVNMHETITANLGDVSTIYTSNGYRFSVTYRDGNNTVQLNLTISDGLRFAADESENSLWEIEILDEDSMDEYYFGVAPKDYFTKMHDGVQKYYTTLYTSFSYKLMDGVNAYYIDKDNVEENIRNGRVYLNKIAAGSTIPGMRAVILECSTPNDASLNRLLPVSTDVDSNAAYWPLQGYIKLNGQAIYPSAYEDEGHEFYVLSVNSDHEKLGFYKYTKELSSNKAFAVVPAEYVNAAKTARVIWYGDETDAVNHVELVFPGEAQYFDLQGRKVSNPQKGVYIVNGKKVIIK